MVDHNTRTDTQFSVFLVNKPGVLAKVCQHLAAAKVNLVALSMMDSTEHGVLRLVADDVGRARDALVGLDVPKTEQEVITTTLPNRPGAIADIVERLALDRIHVHYAYCTTGVQGGTSLGVFKVSNVPKALKALAERKPRRRAEPTAIRANASGRRR